MPANKPEVGDLGSAVGVEEDIRWLEVAADDTLAVCRVDRPRDCKEPPRPRAA
jgi:hypothetical protein